jgi:hypothetical protein
MVRRVRQTFHRRQALLGAAALLGPAAVPLPQGLRRHATGSAPSPGSPSWGRIANGSHRGQPILTGLFFAGPPNPNSLPLYTRHPLDADRLDWSDASDIRFALEQFASVGLNTVKLSYWGHDGETDQWSPAWLFSRQRWPGDGEGTYTESEQVARARQLFQAAHKQNLLVAPMLEVSPAFRFWEEFPANLDGLVERASWLLGNFGTAPNYLRVHDSEGRRRHVVWLIESIHVGPVDPREFAAAFDRAAALVRERTGHLAGFILDPTPLPAYGTHDGPDPAALRTTGSVLGINPFNVASQGPGEPKPQDEITEGERLAYARDIMTTWSGSGIPFIAPAIPGYDAHIVFPDSGTFGFNPTWRRRQLELAVEFATAGLSLDTWNGWTEGYAIPPSREDGDVHREWARATVRAVRRKCGSVAAPTAG